MYDASVYSAQNHCTATDLEQVVTVDHMPDGSVIRVYRDYQGQHRIVAHESIDHVIGYAGVLLDANGGIVWKQTSPTMQGRKATRLLCCYLTSIGIAWYPSNYQTTAGAACYGVYHA